MSHELAVEGCGKASGLSSEEFQVDVRDSPLSRLDFCLSWMFSYFPEEHEEKSPSDRLTSAHPSTKLRAGSFENCERCASLSVVVPAEKIKGAPTPCRVPPFRRGHERMGHPRSHQTQLEVVKVMRSEIRIGVSENEIVPLWRVYRAGRGWNIHCDTRW